MQEHIDFSIGQLLITQAEREMGLTSVFISEPTPLEEKNLGKVFIVAEIDEEGEVHQELLALISEEFTHYYYRSENFDLEIAFEQALQKVNQKLQEAMKEIGPEWLNKLSLVIAVLRGQEMHFTNIGSAQAFLVQQNKIINILEATKAKTQNINPLKIFNNVLSGKLTGKSSVVFCTESLLDYLSPEKIKKTILENKPIEAVEYLEKILTENGSQANFAALIIKLNSSPRTVAQAQEEFNELQREKDLNDSMDQLVSKERATSQLLSPSLWSGLKGNFNKNQGNKITEEPEDKVSNVPKEIKRSPILTTGSKNKYWEVTKKVLNFLKNLGLQIASGLVFLARKIVGSFKQPKEYKNKFSRIPDKTTGKVSQLIEWFKRLTLARKILLALVVIIVFVFAQTIVYKGKKQESAELTTQYEQNLQEVENKINEAKADLLMNNEPGAREKLTQAEETLKQVPEDSKTYEEKNGSDLKDSLAEQLNKINKVVDINDPLEVANFSQINDQISLQGLSLIGDNLYALDAGNDAVYQSALETKEASTALDNQGGKIRSFTKDSAATILVSKEDGTFAQFNPVLKKYSTVEVENVSNESWIKAMVVYGPRLYMLDTQQGQVWKNQKEGDLYQAGTAWLASDKVQVEDGLDMTIDGAVYVLKSEGKLIKLFGGEKDKDFALEEFTPALTGATKVYTDENSEYLYLLDPAEKRLVLFDKDGALVQQYTSESFNDLKGMVIDEINKKAYLLAGTKVYQVDL